jgi:hypothetical protein
VREVLAGSTLGVSWSIEVEERSAEDFMTMARLELDGRRAGSGMGGPKLWPGQPVNVFTGFSDRVPHVMVLVRAAEDVISVHAVSDGGRYAETEDERGRSFDVPLSPVDPESQLRYGLALLPEGEGLWDVRAALVDGRSWSQLAASRG